MRIMTTQHALETFRHHYGAWLTTVKPLLESGDFQHAFATYPFVRCTDTPWTPLRQPVSASRVALVSTGGFYIQDSQAPFDAANVEGDPSYRSFSNRLPAHALGIAHDHFPHHYAEQDVNTILPLDHLHQFVQEGIIGSFADSVYSITGYLTNIAAFANGAAQQIIATMQAENVEAALLIPV
jgi:D-proline reductase (dithiol) PrdB